MNPDLILDNLAIALDLAAPALSELSTPPGDPEITEDLRDLARALYFLLRRYRDSILEATEDPID